MKALATPVCVQALAITTVKQCPRTYICNAMKFAPISDRLSGLGAAKWAVHAEGLHRASLGEAIIMLSIGEPDLPPPASVLDAAASSMRAG